MDDLSDAPNRATPVENWNKIEKVEVSKKVFEVYP